VRQPTPPTVNHEAFACYGLGVGNTTNNTSSKGPNMGRRGLSAGRIALSRLEKRPAGALSSGPFVSTPLNPFFANRYIVRSASHYAELWPHVKQSYAPFALLAAWREEQDREGAWCPKLPSAPPEFARHAKHPRSTRFFPLPGKRSGKDSQ
jgi:hypothetical protein